MWYNICITDSTFVKKMATRNSFYQLSKIFFPFLFWGVAALVGLIIAYKIAQNPENALWFMGLGIVAWITYRKPITGLYLTLFLPVVGELYRLPFGPENGILISDAFIGIVGTTWITKKILHREKLPTTNLYYPWLFFIAIATLSLLQALIFLTVQEVISSALYLIRFIEYTSLFYIALDSIQTQNSGNNSDLGIKKILKTISISSLLIALGGFIQLGVYPNLTKLEEYGWDPHINRLVSTWLDPNFVGGFFAFIICLLIGLLLYSKTWRQRIVVTVTIATLGTALFLTYSRSSYLAIAAGIITIGLLKSRKLLIIITCLFFIGLNFSPRAQERVNDLVHSMSSIIFNTAENPDPTARLRLQSWEQTLSLIMKRPLIGSGYNTLRYINYREGFIENTQIHSASGSDSSLLTILATTGLLGLLPFLYLYWNILKTAFTSWRLPTHSSTKKGVSIGLLSGIVALMVHSLFVNSLLFPPIMIFFWISASLCHQTTEVDN